MPTHSSEPQAYDADTHAPPMTPELQSLRERVIADIIRFAATLPPGRLLTQNGYFIDSGWRFPVKTIEKLGGWLPLCRAAGFRAKTPAANRKMGIDCKTLRRDVVDDIIRVAATLKLGKTDAFPQRQYHEHGGCYSLPTIQKFGWRALCKKAGLFAGNSGHGHNRDRKRRVTPKPTRPTLTPAQFEAALDQLLGRPKMRDGMLRLMNPSARRGPRSKPAAPPPPERGDIIGDLREVSVRVGLASPRLLTWETYHDNGGQYRLDQFLPLGGFDTLRRAA